MDPISPLAIVGAVNSVGGAVVSLSTKLYSFIQATKVVDKSIQALYLEVKGLQNVLNTAQTILNGTVRDHAEDPAQSVEGVWTSIENGVRDCRLTVEALDTLFSDVGTITGTANPIKKMFKQLKLNISTEQIVAVRSRIHTHSLCLQLALQSLSVALCCSSTTDISGTVIPDLRIITSKLDLLTSAVARADIAQSSEEAKLPRSFSNPNLQDHTQRLKSSAYLVLTTASTVLGTRSTEGGGSQYIPTSFSEFGVPLNNVERAAIEEWAQNMDIVAEEFESTEESSDLGGHPSNLVDQSTKSNKAPNSRELDHDPDFLVVKRSFEKAEQHWVEANYPEAEKFFRLGIKRVKKLPTSKQRSFNLNDIWVKVAFTRLHQRDFNEARKLFEPLVKTRGYLKPLSTWFAATDEVSYKGYAYVGLTQVYLCQNLPVDAELMCQKCINHWRTTSSPNVKVPYSKCLQLMALIHEAKGDSVVANIYSEIAVAEGLEASETTSSYMLDIHRLQVENKASKLRKKDATKRARMEEVTLSGKKADAAGAEREEIRPPPKKADTGRADNEFHYRAEKGTNKDIGESATARILSALNYELSSETFDATHALMTVIARCDGNPIGSGERGDGFVPTATDVAGAIEYLCDSGADVNAVDVEGYPPLITAAERGDLAMVGILCDRGANTEMAMDHTSRCALTFRKGMRALHFAAWNGREAVVKILLERGALVNPQTEGQGMPLHFAAYEGWLDVIRILCDAGADLNTRSARNETPLIYALKSPVDIKSVELVVELLCKRGAVISAKSWEGRSALDLAKLKGRDIEKVLMKYSV